MFPATITITVATGVDKILNRVNQDNFGSEYQLTDATSKSVLKIRHSKENKNSLGVVMNRHNVYFEYTLFPTLTDPSVVRSVTTTIREPEMSDPQASAAVAKGINVWLANGTNLPQLTAGVN